MLDVRELERKWLRYKIKRYLPYAVLSVSLLLIVFVLANIDFSKQNALRAEKPQQKQKAALPIKQTAKENSAAAAPSKPALAKNEVTKPPMQIQQPAVQNTQASATAAPVTPQNTLAYAPTAQQEAPSKVLKPSMDFLRKMKDNSVLPESEPTPVQNTQSYVASGSSAKSTSLSQEQSAAEEKVQEEEPQKPKVEIKISKTSKKDLQAIIQRFKKNNNPVLGVFIAKKYYDMGDYHKAYNYALITNQIDSTIEDSWIIFAKSLVKLGQKKRAIKTLKAYVKTSQSSKAKILLDNILTGKFK